MNDIFQPETLQPAAEEVTAFSQSRGGLFITAPGKLEYQRDPLPAQCLQGGHIVLQSLANCRCSSDEKAIAQFTKHPRVPKDGSPVALGHECVQRVAFAPSNAPVRAGDVVLVTPGHTTSSHDPDALQENHGGPVLALGYSYRYFGGLREDSAVPIRLMELVRKQGFGELFNMVKPKGVSLATLAHAEPFGCCANAMRHMFYRAPSGEFRYGIPPRARIALLGGTARMAMITLTILSARRSEDLPSRVAVTGSGKKFGELVKTHLFRGLRSAGVEVILVDRGEGDTLSRLLASGPFDAVFTNYASNDVYAQATSITAPGGNINNFAGAADPELCFKVNVPWVAPFSSLSEEARVQIGEMHHPVSPTTPERYRGIARTGRVGFVGFSVERLRAYLHALPAGSEVEVTELHPHELHSSHAGLSFREQLPTYTDLFIAGTAERASAAYVERELRLAHGAAVNFVDGGATVPVRSKHLHYVSRHQLCGPTVPFAFTNTSEPVSADMARQGSDPIEFDWLVRGVSGLSSAPDLYQDVSMRKPFGSFLVLVELEGFPYVAVSADAFRAKATELHRTSGQRHAALALQAGAEVLERNGDTWSRELEDALYAAYGKTHPLAAPSRKIPRNERLHPEKPLTK